MTTPTPLELLSLAETRRRDPDLALRMADQSGKEHDTITKDKKEPRNVSSTGR